MIEEKTIGLYECACILIALGFKRDYVEAELMQLVMGIRLQLVFDGTAFVHVTQAKEISRFAVTITIIKEEK